MNRAAPWFYYAGDLSAGCRIDLAPEEARHAIGARRLHEGDALCLFDGKGAVASGRIAVVADRGRMVSVSITQLSHDILPEPRIHVAAAMPKGDRASIMLDMLVQLGMASFTPIDCARSVLRSSAKSAERWRRIMIEAAKQSRQAHLPILNEAIHIGEVVQTVTRDLPVWIAHPGGRSISALQASVALHRGAVCVIGPEGGLTEEEVSQLLAAGADIVSLGGAILRIETAAVSMLSLLRLGKVRVGGDL